jgi:hypothetical protein
MVQKPSHCGMLTQDCKFDEDQGSYGTPTKQAEHHDAADAIKAVKQELAGCAAASQLDVTATRRSVKDAAVALDQVLYTIDCYLCAHEPSLRHRGIHMIRFRAHSMLLVHSNVSKHVLCEWVLAMREVHEEY